MKVIRKINNNVAIGKDDNGHEVILFGKGIGFPAIPYTLTDLSKIDRTYYNIDKKFYGLLQEIPDTVFLLVSRLLDAVRPRLPGSLNPNLTFILADHIHFAVDRQRKGMNFSLPYSYELEYEYPELTAISRWIVRQVNERMHVHLDKGEISSITMHFLNAMMENLQETAVPSQAAVSGQADSASAGKGSKPPGPDRTTRVISALTKIVEDFFSIQLDKKSYHYFRFKNHLKFFVQRKERGGEFTSPNNDIFDSVRNAHPDIYECVQSMDDFLFKEFGERCPREELLYLMIHVSQLHNKEDCNRKGITPE